MMIIDGKQIASEITEGLRDDVQKLIARGIVPAIAFIIVGDDLASQIYVRRKKITAESLGMKSIVYKFDKDVSTQELTTKIEYLNSASDVHGILVQLPLPAHIKTEKIINSIDPNKDVDGFTVTNVGRLVTKQDGLFPCTPCGCMNLIKRVTPNIKGMHAVVVGRSNIVGRPMSNLLLNEDCTVTTVHSHTIDPTRIARGADILIAAVGKPHLIDEHWVNKNTIVIDVGMSRLSSVSGETKLVGDVNFDRVKDIVRAITPVPKGVGPMTIAYLMKNTIKAISIQLGGKI